MLGYCRNMSGLRLQLHLSKRRVGWWVDWLVGWRCWRVLGSLRTPAGEVTTVEVSVAVSKSISYEGRESKKKNAVCVCSSRAATVSAVSSHPALPCPALPYPSLPYPVPHFPSLPCPTLTSSSPLLPYPTLPYSIYSFVTLTFPTVSSQPFPPVFPPPSPPLAALAAQVRAGGVAKDTYEGDEDEDGGDRT